MFLVLSLRYCKLTPHTVYENRTLRSPRTDPSDHRDSHMYSFSLTPVTLPSTESAGKFLGTTTSHGRSWGESGCLESLHWLTIGDTGLWQVKDPSNAAPACLPIP